MNDAHPHPSDGIDHLQVTRARNSHRTFVAELLLLQECEQLISNFGLVKPHKWLLEDICVDDEGSLPEAESLGGRTTSRTTRQATVLELHYKN